MWLVPVKDLINELPLTDWFGLYATSITKHWALQPSLLNNVRPNRFWTFYPPPPEKLGIQSSACQSVKLRTLRQTHDVRLAFSQGNYPTPIIIRGGVGNRVGRGRLQGCGRMYYLAHTQDKNYDLWSNKFCRQRQTDSCTKPRKCQLDSTSLTNTHTHTHTHTETHTHTYTHTHTHTYTHTHTHTYTNTQT